jgi:hypothetical protein
MMECPDTFGGIPVVILAGDDYQLASRFQGAIKSISRNDGGKMIARERTAMFQRVRTNSI